MKKNKGRLTLQERERIYSMRSSGYGIRKIGRLIGRNCSVVSRELKGSRQDVRLFSHLSVLDRARHAHNAALVRRRRSRVRERLKNVVVRHYVMERLKKHHWSPSSISARIGGEHPGHSISSRAIYDFIRYDHDHLKNYLVEGGKKRRQRVVNRRGRFREGAPGKRSIDERCVEANDRREIGHLEGDTIVSCRGTAGGLLTLRDRRSRKITVRRVASLEAEHVKSVIKGVLSIKKSEERRTLTVDNGGEFSSRTMKEIESEYSGFLVHYAKPYSPQQRGTNENGNRLIRRFLPKGTDLSSVTSKELHRIEDIINNRPLKCLGWLTPNEFHEAELRNSTKIPVIDSS